MPASMVYTDEARQYGLVRRAGFPHRRVNHSAHVYVDGDVHTNTIEGFWSLLKNGIRGTHRMVGRDYLQSYVNEYTFRYNHRDDVQPMFTTIVERVKGVVTNTLALVFERHKEPPATGGSLCQFRSYRRPIGSPPGRRGPVCLGFGNPPRPERKSDASASLGSRHPGYPPGMPDP